MTSARQQSNFSQLTIQGMVQRVLYTAEDAAPPPIDQYDCIVVDECHRGYLLDRELSETKLSFRGYDDYISKYRRVLDYFDAVSFQSGAGTGDVHGQLSVRFRRGD